VANARAERDIDLNDRRDAKRTGPERAPVGRASVAFDPGLVREGRITSRGAGVVEVAFAPPHRYALAVGSAARVALDGHGRGELPGRTATVVERWDRGHERRYRFALVGRRPRPEPPRWRVKAAAPLCAALRFGRLVIEVDLLGATAEEVVLRVARSTEARLRSADAVEFVADDGERRAPIRLAGWIVRRVLDGAAIRYQFRVDERLSDDGAAQYARLRSRLDGSHRPAKARV
jgi:hypothetical protein